MTVDQIRFQSILIIIKREHFHSALRLTLMMSTLHQLCDDVITLRIDQR